MARDFKSTTIENQIEIVKSRMSSANGNYSGDFNRLKKYFENYGYDEVIYPFEDFLYKDKEVSNKKFRDRIKVQQIINIYNMSSEISGEVIKSILYVEDTMKTVLKINISKALIDLRKNLKVLNTNNRLKIRRRDTRVDKPVEITHNGITLSIKPKFPIPKVQQITYFDLVNSLTFGEVIDLIQKCSRFNNLLTEIYQKLNIPAKVTERKFFATIKYISRIRNLLAHGGTIIGKGEANIYVNSNQLFFYQSMPESRLKSNFYPLRDFLFFFQFFSDKKHGNLLGKISQIYYKHAFSGEEIIFGQKYLFGYEMFTFNK